MRSKARAIGDQLANAIDSQWDAIEATDNMLAQHIRASKYQDDEAERIAKEHRAIRKLLKFMLDRDPALKAAWEMAKQSVQDEDDEFAWNYG